MEKTANLERTKDSYVYEAKGMAQYILEGHNKQETADQFSVSRTTVDYKLKMLGYKYKDLAELRDQRLSKKAKK